MSEIWKDIPGYENLYMITNNGVVKSLVNKGKKSWQKEKYMAVTIGKDGYGSVNLTDKNGKRTKPYIHCLVARAFLPNPYGKSQVNHKNGVRVDNRVENLEWVTREENIADWVKRNKTVIKANKIHGNKGKRRLTANEVRKIRSRLQGEKISFYGLAKEYGMSYVAISKIHTKQTWKQI